MHLINARFNEQLSTYYNCHRAAPLRCLRAGHIEQTSCKTQAVRCNFVLTVAKSFCRRQFGLVRLSNDWACAEIIKLKGFGAITGAQDNGTSMLFSEFLIRKRLVKEFNQKSAIFNKTGGVCGNYFHLAGFFFIQLSHGTIQFWRGLSGDCTSWRNSPENLWRCRTSWLSYRRLEMLIFCCWSACMNDWLRRIEKVWFFAAPRFHT